MMLDYIIWTGSYIIIIIVQNDYFHKFSSSLCFHCRTLEQSKIKVSTIGIASRCCREIFMEELNYYVHTLGEERFIKMLKSATMGRRENHVNAKVRIHFFLIELVHKLPSIAYRFLICFIKIPVLLKMSALKKLSRSFLKVKQ